MRRLECYIERLEPSPPDLQYRNTGERATLEQVACFRHRKTGRWDITESLEGAENGIDTWHENIDETTQSAFEASDMTLAVSLISTDDARGHRDTYPGRGHFWNKLPTSELWHLFHRMTIELEIIYGVVYDLIVYNRETGRAFRGRIHNVEISENEGRATFSAYSYLKVLEQIPVSWITYHDVRGDDNIHRWHLNVDVETAVNLLLSVTRFNSDMALFSATPRIEFDLLYLAGLLGFSNNFYGFIPLDGIACEPTRSIIDFQYIGHGRFRIITGIYDQGSETPENKDIDIIVTDAGDMAYTVTSEDADSTEIAYNTPFANFEGGVLLATQPGAIEVIPATPTSTYITAWGGGRVHCFSVNFSGSSYIYFLKPGAAVGDNQKLGRAKFIGYTSAPGIGGYMANYDTHSELGTNIPWPFRAQYMAYSRQGTHDLIFVTDGVTLFRLEWEGASVDTYEVRTNEEDDSQFGYMTWLRQPNVLLVKEISAGGGFVCLQVCDALTGEITGRRSGEIPSDDSYTNYNLDWGDIDYTSLMCIKYKEHPTDADEAAIEAVCGVTNRAPVRFFVLNDTLDKCLLYTDIELAHGHNLGSKAWITRRYVGTPIAVTLPDGSHYTDTLYSNEVWGVVGDGTVGGSVVFSYNLSRSGKIRLLNLKDQNMAGALTELAKFGGAVLFDDTEVIDYGEGAVTVTPRLNIVGRTLISEEARTWELDRSWLQFDWEPVYDHFFRVLNVKFAGGETKLSTIDPVLGDLSLLAVPPASSIEYKLVFDKHFAQLRGRGILAWHSLPRQIATITTKEQYTYDAGVHPRRNIRRFDKIRIRRTADIGEVYYMEFLVLSIDVSDYDRTIKIRCVSIGQGNGGEWIEDIFPSVPQEYQITEVSSVT